MTEGSPEIRLYARHEDGGFEDIVGFGTTHFDNGLIPSPDDVIVFDEGKFGNRYFLVIRRFLITTLFQSKGWALLVEPLSETGDHHEIARQWAEDTKFFNESSDDADEIEESASPRRETLADIDRNNRDPAYWTFERKELLRKEREARLAAMKAGKDPED